MLLSGDSKACSSWHFINTSEPKEKQNTFFGALQFKDILFYQHFAERRKVQFHSFSIFFPPTLTTQHTNPNFRVYTLSTHSFNTAEKPFCTPFYHLFIYFKNFKLFCKLKTDIVSYRLCIYTFFYILIFL